MNQARMHIGVDVGTECALRLVQFKPKNPALLREEQRPRGPQIAFQSSIRTSFPQFSAEDIKISASNTLMHSFDAKSLCCRYPLFNCYTILLV